MVYRNYAVRDAQKELLRLAHRIDSLNAACVALADVRDPEARREGQSAMNRAIEEARKNFFTAAAAYAGPYEQENF